MVQMILHFSSLLQHLADIVDRAGCDAGLADVVQKNQADLIGPVLLVQAHQVEQTIGIGVFGEPGIQAQALQQFFQPIAAAERAAAEHFAQAGGQDHADGHRLAVAVARVGGEGLEGVAEGMTEVEQGALAGFLFVGGNHLGLVADRLIDRLEQGIGHARGQGLGVGVQPGEEGRVADGAVLDYLRETGPVVAVVKGLQRIEIGDHGSRPVEGADQILALRMIDAGLAANGCIDLGQQGGRHLHHLDPAHVAGRGKACHVADHAPAQGEYGGVALGSEFDQGVENLLPLPDGLVLLAWRQHDALLVFDAGQGWAQPFEVESADVLVGHDQHPSFEMTIDDAAHREQAVADIDRIFAAGMANLDDFHETCSLSRWCWICLAARWAICMGETLSDCTIRWAHSAYSGSRVSASLRRRSYRSGACSRGRRWSFSSLLICCSTRVLSQTTSPRSRSSTRLSSSRTLPPPVASSRASPRVNSSSMACSRLRNPASPSISKMVRTSTPQRRSISWSRSRNSRPRRRARNRPTVVLPEPIGPIRKMRGRDIGRAGSRRLTEQRTCYHVALLQRPATALGRPRVTARSLARATGCLNKARHGHLIHLWP